MKGYVTEQDIRNEAANALLAKRSAQQEDGESVDPMVIEKELSDPRYQRWINDRIEMAKENGRLITPQQAADMKARRGFQEGDRVRYIGPTRLEKSPATGKLRERPSGQLGTINSVVQDTFGNVVQFTFMPDIDKQTREAAAQGLDVEVLQLVTAKWTEFERMV
jgi:hypothetical protein